MKSCVKEGPSNDKGSSKVVALQKEYFWSSECPLVAWLNNSSPFSLGSEQTIEVNLVSEKKHIFVNKIFKNKYIGK